MKYFLIMNPMSRGGRSQRKFQQIFTLLKKYNIDYKFIVTQSIQGARDFSRRANETNYDCIVAIGGDGTINAVINGFYDDNGNRISQAKMGVIYTGTSPDFCKSYNIPLNLEQAVKILKESNISQVRIGKVTFSVNSSPSDDFNEKSRECFFKTNYFACCLNIGLGAALARQANGGIRKYLGDAIGTFISLLKVLATYNPGSFNILRDNKKVSSDNLFNLSIGITPFIASGIKINHGLSDMEDKFYCLIAKAIKMKILPGLLYKIYSGRVIKNTSYLTLDFCTTIEISGNGICQEIEFDGDPHGYLPCRIEMAGSYLDLITGSPVL